MNKLSGLFLLLSALAACALPNPLPYRPVMVDTNTYAVVGPTNALSLPGGSKIGSDLIATLAEVPPNAVRTSESRNTTNSGSAMISGKLLLGGGSVPNVLMGLGSTVRMTNAQNVIAFKLGTSTNDGIAPNNTTYTGGFASVQIWLGTNVGSFVESGMMWDGTSYVPFSGLRFSWNDIYASTFLFEASPTGFTATVPISAPSFSGDGSGLYNVPPAASVMTIGSFNATIASYLKRVAMPTNYTATGASNQVSFGWMTGTNFFFWYDTTSNRWQRAKCEVWQ